MEVRALSCAKCGAPIPPHAAIANGIVTCPFCGATMSIEPTVSDELVAAVQRKLKAAEDVPREKWAAIHDALTLAASGELNLYGTLRDGLTELGRSDAEPIARAVFAIASDFDPTDVMVLERIAQALVKVTDWSQPCELNLPFLAVVDGSPKHLSMKITPETWAELTARPPAPAPAAKPPVVTEPAAEPPKKKRWFSF